MPEFSWKYKFQARFSVSSAADGSFLSSHRCPEDKRVLGGGGVACRRLSDGLKHTGQCSPVRWRSARCPRRPADLLFLVSSSPHRLSCFPSTAMATGQWATAITAWLPATGRGDEREGGRCGETMRWRQRVAGDTQGTISTEMYQERTQQNILPPGRNHRMRA